MMIPPESAHEERMTPPTEEELRRDYIFVRLEVGTPWDHKGHIGEQLMIPRAAFVIEGNGVIAEDICALGWKIEAYIRGTLIPEHIAREEKRKSQGTPAGKV
jgi:hypothetical protein